MTVYVPSSKTLSPPQFIEDPAIIGDPVVGSILRVTEPRYTCDQTPVVTYQWYGDGNPINGVTTPYLEIIPIGEGLIISVEVILSSPAGDVSAMSAEVGPVLPA